MINKEINAHIGVISHKRPFNVEKIREIIGECTFFVNVGEKQSYIDAGAKYVIECGDNICQARNTAIREARKNNLPSIQVSDDLRSLKKVQLKEGKHIVEQVTFEYVCATMLNELKRMNYFYGGVAVTTNRLNYTGDDFSYDKLIVCDLICVMPSKYEFDENMALKEDYDLTISQLVSVGGVVRCNQFLCDFPHRDNKGGANTYRDNSTEQIATDKLYAKWDSCIKKHATREGQISLNYQEISLRKGGQTNLF